MCKIELKDLGYVMKTSSITSAKVLSEFSSQVTY